jgi:hypothetical protein
MGEGVLWRDAGYADRLRGLGGLRATALRGSRRIAYFDSRDSRATTAPFPWAAATWSRAGRGCCADGAVVFEPEEPIGMYRTAPADHALGTDAGRRAILVLAVIDGRRAGLPGVTSLEMLPLLEEFGVGDAMPTSTAAAARMLWIARRGGRGEPCPPITRRAQRVMNHLGMRITAAP